MIYAGQKTDTFLGDGVYHNDIYSGSPVTILGLSISVRSGSGSSTEQIRCDKGSQYYFFNNQTVSDLAKNCDVVAYYGQTGDSFSITYIEGSTTPEQILYNTHLAEVGTTTPQVLNGFTYGEVITGFFLFVILLMMFFGGIVNQVAGVKGRARNSRNPKI